MSPQPSVIILGLYYSSLHIASSLGPRGVRLYGIDIDDHPIGAASRYINHLKTSCEFEKLVQFLIQFATGRDHRPVLMPLTDRFVLFASRYRKQLEKHYSFTLPPAKSLDPLLTKAGAQSRLDAEGICQPRTWTFSKDRSPQDLPADLQFPVIVKPVFKHHWSMNTAVLEFIGDAVMVMCAEDEAQLTEALGVLSPVSDLVIQEFVPGPSDTYYYYVGYRDRAGRMITSFLGNKVRTLLDCLGSETLLRSVHLPELLTQGDEIVHKLGYVGPIGIDFKYDERDRCYKVIEINCRFGLNDGYLMRHGVDLPHIYYLDSQGIPPPESRDYPASVTWYDPFRDLDWMRLYNGGDKVGWGAWLAQLPFYDSYAFLDKTDPWPFAKSLMGLILRGVKRLNPLFAPRGPQKG